MAAEKLTNDKSRDLVCPHGKRGLAYQGVSGDKISQGRIPGEALDALTTQMTDNGSGFVVVQSLRADAFFSAVEQQHLSELMQEWRTARDSGRSLPIAEQTELDALVEEELRASAQRAGTPADDLGH